MLIFVGFGEHTDQIEKIFSHKFRYFFIIMHEVMLIFVCFVEYMEKFI